MREMEPTELVFWGVMSLGVMAGFMLAYPFNVWMVSQKLKHSLMTERKPGCKFDGVIAAEQEMQLMRMRGPSKPIRKADIRIVSRCGSCES